jgi:LysR family transcriptional regulator, regulator for bpeEF and oprC
MDHLQAIRVFARVVEAGSFTKAADSLGMPKPTVTKLVQSLETRLQTKLLNRTTRRVSVTSDGAAYYERTTRLLNELDEIEAGIGNARVNPRGRLRIDVASSVANMIVVPSLPGFVARYPDVLIELGIGDRPVDLIGDNVDCAIRAGVLGDSSLVARRVGELGWVTCAAPAYLQRAGIPQHPRALEAPQHVVVGYASAQSGRISPLGFRRGGESVDVQPRCALTVNEGYAGVVAAIAGLGVVQTARFMAQRHIDEGSLVPILTEWDLEPYPVYAVYPQNRHLSAKLRVFVNWVAELFAQHPYAQGR